MATGKPGRLAGATYKLSLVGQVSISVLLERDGGSIKGFEEGEWYDR